MQTRKKNKVICRDLENKKHLVAIDKLVFRPSVYGVLIEDNKVFLSAQWDGFDFPGGGIEINETIEDALKREFFEETGYKIKVDEILHCQSGFYKPKFEEKYWNTILMYYRCYRVGGKISIKNLDDYEKKYCSLPQWINIGELSKIKFYNGVNSIKLIKKALKK